MPYFKNSFILETFTFIILALECSPSARIGICQFYQDFAFMFNFIKAAASSAQVTCSPDDKRTSSSLLSKLSEIFFANLINSFVEANLFVFSISFGKDNKELSTNIMTYSGKIGILEKSENDENIIIKFEIDKNNRCIKARQSVLYFLFL